MPREYSFEFKVFDKNNIEGSVSDLINRILSDPYPCYWGRLKDFEYSEELCWQHYSVVISEIILMNSNKIAEKFHQKPPHTLQLDGKIPCSLKPYEDLSMIQRALRAHHRHIRSDFANLLIGDYGINLPNGWEIIPRHERNLYLDELETEFDHNELQEFDIYPQASYPLRKEFRHYARGLLQALIIYHNNLSIIEDKTWVDRFYYDINVVFGRKENRILLLTSDPLVSIVTLELLWTGDRQNSISKASPLFYDNLNNVLG